MSTSFIYTLISDVFFDIFPNTVIDYIIIPYIIEQYKYKYRIDTTEQYYNIQFNQQLNMLYCSSGQSYKLLDFSVGLTSSLIDTKSFDDMIMVFYFNSYDDDPYFVANIIYLFDDILIIYEHGLLIKYIFCDRIYIYNEQLYINNCTYTVCTYKNRIYIYSFDDNTSHITAYDVKDLNRIQQSDEYICNDDDTDRNISIYNDIIYVHEQLTNTTYNIHTHDITTLDRTSTRSFTRKSVGNNIIIYKDKIYDSADKTIYMYDLFSHELIHSFDIKITYPIEHISISNNVMMISNNHENVIYSCI